MDMDEILKECLVENEKKILLLVLDGLGDTGSSEGTPLERAITPHLDELTKKSALGLLYPIGPGITPGSGPAHLALFGYDPVKNLIGRGVLEAVGAGMKVTDRDIAIRGNFCTVERVGKELIVKDRRAGRISTQENKRLIDKLSGKIKKIDGVEIIFKTVMEHRFCILLRFPEKVNNLHAMLTENDPQAVEKNVLPVKALHSKSKKTERIIQKLLLKVEEILMDEKVANYVLLRGYSTIPDITPFPEKYKLRAAGIAVYPMYRGLASLAGMEILELAGDSIEDEVVALKKNFNRFNFFFLHIKKTDSFGEDGNEEGKRKIIEEFDSLLPEILSLKFEVIAITGDHSTPFPMRGHSWHPVPLLIHSPYVIGRINSRFTERECLKGELGFIKSTELIFLLLAHSLKLKKFGA